LCSIAAQRTLVTLCALSTLRSGFGTRVAHEPLPTLISLRTYFGARIAYKTLIALIALRPNLSARVSLQTLISLGPLRTDFRAGVTLDSLVSLSALSAIDAESSLASLSTLGTISPKTLPPLITLGAVYACGALVTLGSLEPVDPKRALPTLEAVDSLSPLESIDTESALHALDTLTTLRSDLGRGPVVGVPGGADQRLRNLCPTHRRRLGDFQVGTSRGTADDGAACYWLTHPCRRTFLIILHPQKNGRPWAGRVDLRNLPPVDDTEVGYDILVEHQIADGGV